MNHIFNDLSTKYDNVARHMRQMDIRIAQTVESVKRQQGTLPGKTDKNPKECNAVGLRSGKKLSDLAPRKFTEAEKGKQKESEQPPSDAPTAENDQKQPVKDNPSETKQTAEAVRPSPDPVPARENVPKVPYPVPAKATRKSVCLARGSCRGNEGLSIDETSLVSVNSDPRKQAKAVS
ncbi:hypothetical protein F2Q69_00020001 [Brassica cretica]|uniref:Uncharacterized protein n=1 Tax=Brassica cretica TaxID=69181 RepID=A0A8S9Q9K2_BRACR|nr:hypothetical protein F2Q69_00020001 [Brassica cretica]